MYNKQIEVLLVKEGLLGFRVDLRRCLRDIIERYQFLTLPKTRGQLNDIISSLSLPYDSDVMEEAEEILGRVISELNGLILMGLMIRIF